MKPVSSEKPWADEWDPVKDSPFNKKGKEKEESGRTRAAMKSIFTLTWMKNLGRKSEKNQPST